MVDNATRLIEPSNASGDMRDRIIDANGQVIAGRQALVFCDNGLLIIHDHRIRVRTAGIDTQLIRHERIVSVWLNEWQTAIVIKFDAICIYSVPKYKQGPSPRPSPKCGPDSGIAEWTGLTLQECVHVKSNLFLSDS